MWVKLREAPGVLKEKLGIEVRETTLRKWKRIGKYPEIFSRLGGMLYVDVNAVSSVLEQEREKWIKETMQMKQKIRDATLGIGTKRKRKSHIISTTELKHIVDIDSILSKSK